MANKKITDYTALTAPVSTDLVELVDVSDTTDSADGSSKKSTLANIITKAHGLSDGIVAIASGVMGLAVAGVDYLTGSSTNTLTNKTIDADGTGNVITNIGASEIKAEIITGLTAETAIDDADVVMIYDASATALRKMTKANLVAGLSGGGGVSDGDKGDITVSGTGTIFTIDNDVVTYAKMQNVSATDILLGRSTIGAGDVEEIPLTSFGRQLLDDTSFSAMRTTLGLAIGTDVQAQGATLTALEALTLAQGDLLYATGADTLTRLAKGTASQELRMNSGATAPEWYTPVTGDDVYDYIISASGGDYTTLGACLAVAPSGSTIFIKSGTYVESAINVATTNLTIIGENSRTSIVSMGANALTLSGTDITLKGFSIQSTGGTITLSSNNKMMSGMHFSHSAGADKCTISGANNTITGCIFVSTSSATLRQFSMNCTESVITGNVFLLTNCGSGTTGGAIEFGGSQTTVTNNYFEAGASPAVTRAIVGIGNTAAPNSMTFAYNTINGNSVCAGMKVLGSGGNVTCSIIGNNFYTVTGSSIESSGAYVNISNNVIYNSNGASNSYGVYVNGTKNTVSGNTIYGSGSPSVAGVYVHTGMDDNIVTGNMIYNFATGITINASDCDNNIVDANRIVNCTAGITDNGTGSNIGEMNTANGVSLINAIKKYTVMKNTSGGTLAVGDLVVWKAVANANEFTTTTTAGDDKVFGVLVESSANNAFSRVQIFGKNTVLKVNGTVAIAIGDPITTYTSAGIGAKAAAGDMVIGYALEAYAVADSLGVIDVLLITPRLI
jgi:hypothetical protein